MEPPKRADKRRLTHVDRAGRPRMVDVSAKPPTARRAVAEAEVAMEQATISLIVDGGGAKGDVMTVAEIAGVMGAKRTAELIPLCHPIPLTDLVVETREMRPAAEIEIKSLPCRIERMHRLAPEVMAVFLRLPANEEFNFFAGQYLDIMLPQNRRRSFSIASCPGRDELLELHIRKVSSGEFTQQLFNGMKEKTLLRIEGPLGQFWFRRESPRPALLIGGGTGYAPLRSMLRDLLSVGDRRPLHLYWGAQTRQDLYEDEQVRALSAAHPNLHYTPVLSDPQPADNWNGRRGLVHAAALQDHPQLQDFDVYASGPPAMVEAVRHEYTERGLPAQQLFFDSFDYAPDVLAKLDVSR